MFSQRYDCMFHALSALPWVLGLSSRSWEIPGVAQRLGLIPPHVRVCGDRFECSRTANTHHSSFSLSEPYVGLLPAHSLWNIGSQFHPEVEACILQSGRSVCAQLVGTSGPLQGSEAGGARHLVCSWAHQETCLTEGGQPLRDKGSVGSREIGVLGLALP